MINIPFNFQPTTVSVETSSFTVPSGKYANVNAYVENGGSFTIDGDSALISQAGVLADVIKVASENTASYTVPDGYRFEGQATHAANASVVIDSVKAGECDDLVAASIKAGPGSVIKTTGASNTNIDITGFSIRESSPETNSTHSFWLPSGTVISGSGSWRATVSLFNEIS